jgi:hypothetical protein
LETLGFQGLFVCLVTQFLVGCYAICYAKCAINQFWPLSFINNRKDGTIRECLRLNGFPDTFDIDIDYRKALDLMGNTVVVPVIKNICDRIFEGDFYE